MSTKKVVIICKNVHHHAKKMNFPIIGETEINDDGTVEVPEEVAAQLVEGSEWDYVKTAPKAKKSAKPAVEEEEEEEETEEEDEDLSKTTEKTAEEKLKEEEVDRELKKTLIRNFTGPDAEAELKAMATQAGVSKTVIGKAKGKTDLINMILAKMELADKVELLKQQNQDS